VIRDACFWQADPELRPSRLHANSYLLLLDDVNCSSKSTRYRPCIGLL